MKAETVIKVISSSGEPYDVHFKFSYNILRKEIEAAQRKEKKLKEQIEQALKTGIETVWP